MVIVTFVIIAVVSMIQAFLSSAVNRGTVSEYYLFLSGLAVSGTWVLLSKVSNNLIRDSLIWDVVIAVVFTLVFVNLGHATNFTTKHWIGVIATLAVFIYWSAIK